MQRLAPARLRVGDAESASPRELGSQGQTVGLAGRQARPSGTASVSRSVGPILLILSYESELLIYFWAKIQGSRLCLWLTFGLATVQIYSRIIFFISEQFFRNTKNYSKKLFQQ